MAAREVAAVRDVRRSLEAVDTALQGLLHDLRVLEKDYAQMAVVNARWAEVLGKPVLQDYDGLSDAVKANLEAARKELGRDAVKDMQPRHVR